VLGVREVNFIPGRHVLPIVDQTLAA